MKKIPYSRQSIDERDIQAVIEVLRSDFMTQGPNINVFEEALRRYLNVDDVIVVSNGTAALHLSYLALDLKDAVVFTSPITFAATSNMLLLSGAKIKFVDVDPNTALMDVNSLENAMKSLKPGQKSAIVPISMNGIAANLPAIKELADKYNSAIVEDAAHSLGTEYTVGQDTYKSASCKHSDMAILSFHPLKAICCGEGGAVCTNNPKLAHKVRVLRNHGLVRKENSYERIQEEIGLNYRMTDMQAALGVSQLRKLPYLIGKRKVVASKYYEKFSEDPFINHFTTLQKVTGNSYHLFVIKFKSHEIRDFAYNFLMAKGIETQVHYQPLYKLNKFAEIVGKIQLPGAEAYSNTCLSIPIFPDLSEEDQDYVIDSLSQLCRRL